ncbi:MAG: DUF1570 domain-containing protein [Planctomycetota bacterium]
MSSTILRTGALVALTASAIAFAQSGAITADELMGDGNAGVVATPEVLSVEDWNFAQFPGQVIRTRHFRVFTTESDTVLRDRLASFSEYALAHYRTAITPLPLPRTRLDTYLMDSRTQWETVTKRLMGQQAEQLVGIQRGGFAARGVGVYYDLGLYDTMAIAAHEGWHQYTQRAFKEQLPVYLEEGIAAYMEGHRWSHSLPRFKAWANTERFDQLRLAHSKGELAPLSELLQSRPQDYLGETSDRILTFYAQLWALVHFLQEGDEGAHRASLALLLRDAASGNLGKVMSDAYGERAARLALAGRTGDEVFRLYFGEDLEALAASYEAFIGRVVSTGSREAIAAGRSPL